MQKMEHNNVSRKGSSRTYHDHRNQQQRDTRIMDDNSLISIQKSRSYFTVVSIHNQNLVVLGGTSNSKSVKHSCFDTQINSGQLFQTCRRGWQSTLWICTFRGIRWPHQSQKTMEKVAPTGYSDPKELATKFRQICLDDAIVSVLPQEQDVFGISISHRGTISCLAFLFARHDSAPFAMGQKDRRISNIACVCKLGSNRHCVPI